MTYLWRGQPGLLDANRQIEDERIANPGASQEGHITYFSWPMPPPGPPAHGSWPRWRLHLADGEEPCRKCSDWVRDHPEAKPRSQQDRRRRAS